MNARQQEPLSSHLHGAGYNTSISRQRRNHEKQGVVFVAAFYFWKYQAVGSGAGQRARADAGVRL